MHLIFNSFVAEILDKSVMTKKSFLFGSFVYCIKLFIIMNTFGNLFSWDALSSLRVPTSKDGKKLKHSSHFCFCDMIISFVMLLLLIFGCYKIALSPSMKNAFEIPFGKISLNYVLFCFLLLLLLNSWNTCINFSIVFKYK